MNRSGTRGQLAVALLGLGLFTAFGFAQPPRPGDPILDATARQRVADQKAESDVLQAIADAERQAKLNPGKAIQTLKGAQVIVDSPVVSAAARKKLVEMLDNKIAAIQGRAVPNPGPKADPIGVTVKKEQQAIFDSYSLELKSVNDGIQRYAKLKQNGSDKEADYELAKLSRMYPNNPAVIGIQGQDNFAARVKDSLAFADVQQKRITGAMMNVDKTALPIGGNGDVEFPPNWQEMSARRLAKTQLTAQEKKIIEALNKPVTIDWNNRPLDEALQDLSDRLDQKLFLDKKAVEDLGIDLRKPVSLQTNGVSAKTVMRQTLATQGLTFVIKDQVIQVVDVERAKNMLSTRVYYLGDLVQGTGPFGEAKWGPFLNMQQTQQNVDTIIKSITQSIDPLCWKERGGPCSITFHFPSMSIIVRASAEVHSSLGATMGGGK